MNRDQLYSMVKSYVYDRADIDPMIPTWVALAERRIYRQLRTPGNEYTLNVRGKLDVQPVPRDLLEYKTVIVNGKPLQRISDTNYLVKYQQSDAEAPPAFFARIADHMYFYPSPPKDRDYVLSLVYYRDFSGLLVDPESTNNILRVAPDLYLYASLTEAMAWLGHDERAQTWEALFNQTLTNVNEQAHVSDYAGSTLQVQPVSGIRL